MADISVVLRIAGLTLDIDSIIAQHCLAPESTWKRGESDRRGGTHDTTGMNLFVVSAASSETGTRAAAKFFAENQNLIRTLQQQKADMELDFGVMVPSARSYAPSIAFDPAVAAVF